MSFGAPITQRHDDLAVSDGLSVGETRSPFAHSVGRTERRQHEWRLN
jgi:hypothetical protein